jgi:uncharacterized protein (DUF934 family)
MNAVKDRRVVSDEWRMVGDDEPAGAHTIVSLTRWNREHDALPRPTGLVLRSDESPDNIEQLGRLALIAIDFPGFQDGRGYSSARALRTRLGFRGELRAVGDVMRDQIFLMHRCGIDSFAVKASKDATKALDAFDDFSVTYQGAADDERPLFRRVAR